MWIYQRPWNTFYVFSITGYKLRNSTFSISHLFRLFNLKSTVFSQGDIFVEFKSLCDSFFDEIQMDYLQTCFKMCLLIFLLTNKHLREPAMCSSQHPLTVEDGAATAPLLDTIGCDVEVNHPRPGALCRVLSPNNGSPHVGTMKWTWSNTKYCSCKCSIRLSFTKSYFMVFYSMWNYERNLSLMCRVGMLVNCNCTIWNQIKQQVCLDTRAA